MSELKFIVPGRPQAKQRPRVVRGRAYTPKATNNYEKFVALQARSAMSRAGLAQPIEGPVALAVEILFRRPKHIPPGHLLQEKPGRVPLHLGGSFPDLSNVLKAIEDGCNGVVFGDDCQVCHLEAAKAYCAEGEPEGVVVRVWPL